MARRLIIPGVMGVLSTLFFAAAAPHLWFLAFRPGWSTGSVPGVTGANPRSGDKYRTAQGFNAVKDGIRPSAEARAQGSVDRAGLSGKPRWLKAPVVSGDGYDFVRRTVREHRLATVCEEAKCPNIGECWNAGTATIMLMGAVCTRACRFCSVDTGNPHGWLDADEPANVADSVALMKLRYVVLTSVNRDDLPDGGAAHYAACVRISPQNPDITRPHSNRAYGC